MAGLPYVPGTIFEAVPGSWQAYLMYQVLYLRQYLDPGRGRRTLQYVSGAIFEAVPGFWQAYLMYQVLY